MGEEERSVIGAMATIDSFDSLNLPMMGRSSVIVAIAREGASPLLERWWCVEHGLTYGLAGCIGALGEAGRGAAPVAGVLVL